MAVEPTEPGDQGDDDPHDPWRKASHVETIFGIVASAVTIALGAWAITKGLR